MLMVVFVTAFGYSQSFILAKTIDRGDYFYIPHSCFSDSVGAVLFQGKTLSKVNPGNRPIGFYWTSRCDDGYYILTVTPEQIFFSTGHENPNPDFLYWVMDIRKKQFQFINDGIRRKAPGSFDILFHDESKYSFVQHNFHEPCLIPKNWNTTTENRFSACCDSTIARQLRAYFKILNSYIPIETEKLQFADIQQSLIKFPKYFSSFEPEIHDWMGMRPRQKKEPVNPAGK